MNSTEFLDIGRHCSEESCRQLDFLPFSCPSCSLPFCSAHYKPDGGHDCPSYDPALADNRIPSCPLCSTPISFPPGTDPNGPMDAHLSTRCPVLHPHLAQPSTSTSSSSASSPAPRKKAPNECRAPRCRTKMVVPIRCDQCRASFCPTHRFPSDHACAGGAAAASSSARGAEGKGAAAAAAAAASAGASVKRAFGGLRGLRTGPSSSAPSASVSASTSSTKASAAPAAAPPTARLASSSSRSAAAAPPPPRPASQPSRAGLAALRRAQHAASTSTSASAKPAPLGTSANPLVLDSSSGDDSDVQVVRPAAAAAGSSLAGRRVPGAGAGRAAGGGAGAGGAGAGAGAGSTSAAKKALASTGLRGAPSKRALQEQESARKALEVRAKKGLLTEDEKVRYATMQAMQANGKGKGDDDACVVS